jgi:hypothetical protein
MTMTTTRQILEDVRGYGAARRVRLTGRAREQVSKLGLTTDDVRYGLMQATELEIGGADGPYHVGTVTRDAAPVSATLLFWDAFLLVTEVRP